MEKKESQKRERWRRKSQMRVLDDVSRIKESDERVGEANERVGGESLKRESLTRESEKRVGREICI